MKGKDFVEPFPKGYHIRSTHKEHKVFPIQYDDLNVRGIIRTP